MANQNDIENIVKMLDAKTGAGISRIKQIYLMKMKMEQLQKKHIMEDAILRENVFRKLQKT